MEIDDSSLIDYVSQYPYLYDKTNKSYKNKIVRENAWKTIASLLSEKGDLSRK